MDNVLNVTFNSKEDIKKDMQEESEVFKSIMSQYNEETNPLQDSFLVKVSDINEL